VAIRLEDKQQIVSEVSEAAKSALSAVVADLRGISACSQKYPVEEGGGWY